MRKLSEYTSPVYERLLPEIFKASVPEEELSSCSNCSMTCARRTRAEERFSEVTKCCTYHPMTPNYLVGGVLSDMGCEGREKVLAAIKGRVGVYPEGLCPSKSFASAYQAMLPAGGFGRTDSLKCPYYETATGHCMIWRYRDAVCSTWFCRHTAGAKGRKFWDAVRVYLLAIQADLAAYCMYRAGLSREGWQLDGIPGDGSSPQDLSKLEDFVDPDEYDRRWGKWRGREVEYYLLCYENFSQLTRGKFDCITRKRGALVADVQSLRQEIATGPAILKRNPKLLPSSSAPEMYQVRLMPANLEISVPSAVIDLFDGVRKTGEIIDKMARENDVELRVELILALWHAGALVPVEENSAAV